MVEPRPREPSWIAWMIQGSEIPGREGLWQERSCVVDLTGFRSPHSQSEEHKKQGTLDPTEQTSHLSVSLPVPACGDTHFLFAALVCIIWHSDFFRPVNNA